MAPNMFLLWGGGVSPASPSETSWVFLCVTFHLLALIFDVSLILGFDQPHSSFLTHLFMSLCQ